MKTEHIIALAMIPLATAIGALLCACFARMRDIFFFAMVSLAVFAERLDVNFFSEAWYRGTTRGIQVTVIEMMGFGVLFGCLVGRRDGGRRFFWPASLGLMLLYLLDATISVISSDPKVFGVFELSKIMAALVVFLASAAYVRSRREWNILVVALGCVVGFEGVWAVKQHFLMHLDRVAGTLDHANSLSMYFCMTTPLLVAVACAGWSKRLKLFCGISSGLATVGLILTYSRAGIPVFGVAVGATILACMSWRLTPSKVVIRLLVVAGAAALVIACWSQIERRYSEATLEEEYLDTNVDGRGVYLRLATEIAKDHFMGVGLNNWSYYVSKTYGPRIGYRFVDYDYLVGLYGTDDDKLFANSYLAAPAHNLGALTLGELGIPGILIFTALWLRWFSMGLPFIIRPRGEAMRTMGIGLLFGICGIFGQSLTEWVYRQTPILFTFQILVGALASLAYARTHGTPDERVVAVLETPVEPLTVEDELLVGEGA
ncbi:MAG TPA: O-antigen ligase family protein [Opitutaceae bacterium]|nr:O-antigen ligase family protein [Opitutaceae bacterium]